MVDNRTEDFPDLLFQDPENDDFRIKDNKLYKHVGASFP
jgi:hypothetical protein